MKIGVISDSHKDFEALERVLDIFEKEKVEAVIHLGDDYADIDNVNGKGSRGALARASLIRVPGVYDGEYADPHIPHRLVVKIENIKMLLTHSSGPHKKDFPDDLAPTDMARRENAEIILCGHTHIPLIEEKEGFIIFNPGHVKQNDNRGYPPSYAIIEINKGKIDIKIIDLFTGGELFNSAYNLAT